jgi:lysophospholipase L1-like esterase
VRKTRPEAVVAHFGWDAADQQINGVWLTPCQPAFRQHYLTKLDVAVQQIRTEVSDVPIFFMNEYMGTWAASRQSIGCYNKIMVTYAASGKIRLLDYNQMLCAKKGQCRKTDDEGKPLFVDGVHFTPQGRRFIAPILEDQIAEALATSSHKPAG